MSKLETWIAEQPEQRYVTVERRETGYFEARAGSDIMNEESPFSSARGATISDAVANLSRLAEVAL